MTWAVDRDDHDGRGYKPYFIEGNEMCGFPTFHAAREFVEEEAANYVDPMEYTWRVRPYEMDSSNAHLQELYGKQPDPQPAKYRVVIEVLGGVAEVTECPDEVEVVIIYHANAEKY